MKKQRATVDIFWENVERYAKEKDVTMVDLSKKLGKGKGYLSNLKARRALPKAEMIDTILELLDLILVDLAEDWGDEK